jgi:hypothetical protein
MTPQHVERADVDLELFATTRHEQREQLAGEVVIEVVTRRQQLAAS